MLILDTTMDDDGYLHPATDELREHHTNKKVTAHKKNSNVVNVGGVKSPACFMGKGRHFG